MAPEASKSVPGGQLERILLSALRPKKGGLERLLAGPRGIPREVSAILGAKRLHKRVPKRVQNRAAFGICFGIDFGSLLGGVLAPKMVENSLGFPLGAAKSRPREYLFDPEALQEHSKRPPGALQDAFRRPRGSKRSPGSHFGPLLPQFSIPCGRRKHPPTTLRTTVCVCVTYKAQSFHKLFKASLDI